MTVQPISIAPPPVLDRHRQPPVIAMDDPLAVMFALQHDYRERLAEALVRAEAVLDRLDADPELSPRDALLGLAEIGEIIKDVLDPQKTQEWLDAGRPLPWLDTEMKGRPDEIRRAVLRVAGIESSIEPQEEKSE